MEEKVEKAIEKAEGKAAMTLKTGEMKSVLVDIYSPYLDFIEEYLRFSGSTETLEDMLRRMICWGARLLARNMCDFVNGHVYGNVQDFAFRYAFVLNADGP